ncbi:MAG: hypothetical protein QOJ65_2348 [Fimbriimonadaceae bacterium]|jgi:hypothetical protein|nr:hypothetical protein [Fimbriimonadaceae bacterium]
MGEEVSERNVRFNARVVYLGPTTFLVEQTKYSEKERRYVIDHRPDGDKIERHVRADDDAEIADAVRAALSGTLSKSRG